jgi:predicted permease
MNLPAWFDNRASDFRYALRMIRKTPGVSAVAVLSLALGIGANTSIFSLVDTLLLKRLPVKSPQELYMVAANPARPSTSWNYPDYVAFRDHNNSFSGLAACSYGTMAVGLQVESAQSGATTELAWSASVSGNYFETLGVVPELGRLLNPEDDRIPSASPYVVLSYEYWIGRFNGDPGVIGRKLRLNGYPFTVVGVARRGFQGTDTTAAPNLFSTIMMRGELTGNPFARWNNRHWYWMQMIGRLKPGATVKQAESELFNVYREQELAESRTVQDQRFVARARPVMLMPAARGYSLVRNRLEKPLVVLMVVVALVLLIACANVANLMLARGAARQRELAVRLAIGASRSRLMGQLLVESVLIALIGGGAGLLLSYFGVQGLLMFVPQSSWSHVSVSVSPDARLLGFTFAVSVLTGVLFGIAPALQSTRPDLAPVLKDEVPGASGPKRFSLRNGLVVAQVALSLLLLIGAGLFVRSLEKLRDIEPGFRRDHTVVVSVDPGRNGYKGQRLRDFYERLRTQVAELPGVQSMSLAGITPLGGSRWMETFTIEGYQKQAGDIKSVDMNSVGPRFFETVGIPVLLGREFRDEDNPPYSLDPPIANAPGVDAPEPPGRRVSIINESMAKRFFAGRNPVGLHLTLSEKYDPARAYEVVGVVKDAHYFGLREALEPMVYVPTWRPGAGPRTLCFRTNREAPELIEVVRRQVTAIDPAIPVLDWKTMKQQIDNNILEDRLIATLSGFFGFLALLLAGVGLYGVISYAVTRRTREIGIRMALGAERSSVLWLVIRDASLLVITGAALGIPSALALTRLVKAFLYGVGAQDPITLAASALVLICVAAVASLLPARRATKVDPLVALRYE